jgi:cysteine desulfurase/selenocysteine lyase
MEHHSNIVPWHLLRERRGAVLRWAPVDDEGEFLVEEYEKLFSPRTKLVAITHMSNVLGTVTPIAEIIRIAHERGVPALVDGAQSAVHLDVDVRELDADFYIFTGHKVYGPTGIGVLYGKREWLERLPPYQGGGEMIKTVACGEVTYGDPPHRFEAGTPAIIEAVGLGACLALHGPGRATEHPGARGAALRLRARAALGHELDPHHRPGRGKGPILSFEMQGAHAHDVATVIDRQGVAVRAGTHCAMPLLDRFGANSTCRASFGLYNTMEEVDKLADALARAQAMFS